MAWATTGHQFTDTPKPLPQRWQQWYDQPRNSGVWYVWGHAYEFSRSHYDWPDFDRVYQPLAGKPDVWYCTNIELFDYESARQRLAIAANRRSVVNPSGQSVWIAVDGRLIEVPPATTLTLA